MAGASKKQWDMGLDVVWYLKGAKDLELTYRCDGLAVVAYADSDFANDKVSGKSVYGYVVYVEVNPDHGWTLVEGGKKRKKPLRKT
jgi:hypothetical protein